MLGVKSDNATIAIEDLARCLKDVLIGQPEVEQSIKEDYPILYSYIKKV